MAEQAFTKGVYGVAWPCVALRPVGIERPGPGLDIGIIGFESLDPTTEVMARHIFDIANQKLADYRSSPDAPYPLRGHVTLLSVRVWETSSSWAEYQPATS